MVKISELVSQMAAMFMGNGVVSLSDSIKESLVGAIRDEFEMQKQELIVSFGRKKQEMLDSFALNLAVKYKVPFSFRLQMKMPRSNNLNSRMLI